LSLESVEFTFFDDAFSDDTKIKMVQTLKKNNNVDGDSTNVEKRLCEN
jgi:hypothetical protein